MDLNKLTASIQVHEGLRLHVYQDTTGHATIGYGRELNEHGISPTEAEYLLANDIRDVLAQAENEAWWPHVTDSDARSRALLELVFNLGVGGVRSFTHAIACLLNDDFAGAAANFRDSLWSKQVGQRAITLTDMIRSGSD